MLVRSEYQIGRVNSMSFKNRTLNKEVVVKKAISALETGLSQKTSLTNNPEWFLELKKLYEQASYKIKNPENIHQEILLKTELSMEKIKDSVFIQNLINALRVMYNAFNYKPNKVKTENNHYTVHNKVIAGMIKDEYSKEELDQVTEYLNENRVFDLTDNPNYGFVINKKNGLVEICGSAENYEMNQRCWITDIMRIGDIQKYERPETWTTTLATIAKYYETQAIQFDKLIANPEIYHSDDISEGIPHIFIPETFELDKDWFNNKRLESHGLALKEFSNAIIDGLFYNKNYGFQSVEEIPENIFLAIDNLSKFFSAIDYVTAPTSGNWEEICFEEGLTTDVEIVRSGLNAYKDLLYNPKYSGNKSIIKFRESLQKYKPLQEQELEQLISKGESRVRKMYLKEAPEIREIDASLAFITTSDIKLADDIIEDVKKNFEILNALEKELVRENGILRYKPFEFKMKDGNLEKSADSYLGLNYSCALDKTGKINLEWKEVLDKYGSKDASDPDIFYLRAQFTHPDTEAEWFMVSDMSVGYGKQIEKIIKNAKLNNRKLSAEEIELIEFAKKKQTEYLNRSIARITDENPSDIYQIKANGLDVPRVTLPEAYQYVTDINQQPVCIPGVNVPLAWALASLYNAFKQQYKTLGLLKI